MDKIKTGILIREARTKKNYTQSELGDLLGVSNKAISRWENGESFPDVGILENLAGILELRIQDIVTGDSGTDGEDAVIDVVRVAKIQQKEKRRKLIGICLFSLVILCGICSGLSSMGRRDYFADESMVIYVILMALSFTIVLICSKTRDTSLERVNSKFGKITIGITLISFLWVVIMTWSIFVMVANGYVPFGMELSSVGPFIKFQLIILFTCNLLLIAFLMYRYIKYNEVIQRECFTALSVIYIVVLYSNLLHGMSTIEGAIQKLAVRTTVAVLVTGIFIAITKLIEKKKLRTNCPD